MSREIAVCVASPIPTQGKGDETPANAQECALGEPFDAIADVMAHFIDTFGRAKGAF